MLFKVSLQVGILCLYSFSYTNVLIFTLFLTGYILNTYDLYKKKPKLVLFILFTNLGVMLSVLHNEFRKSPSKTCILGKFFVFISDKGGSPRGKSSRGNSSGGDPSGGSQPGGGGNPKRPRSPNSWQPSSTLGKRKRDEFESDVKNSSDLNKREIKKARSNRFKPTDKEEDKSIHEKYGYNTRDLYGESSTNVGSQENCSRSFWDVTMNRENSPIFPPDSPNNVTDAPENVPNDTGGPENVPNAPMQDAPENVQDASENVQDAPENVQGTSENEPIKYGASDTDSMDSEPKNICNCTHTGTRYDIGRPCRHKNIAPIPWFEAEASKCCCCKQPFSQYYCEKHGCDCVFHKNCLKKD